MNTLQGLMEKYNFLPELIFNMDETMMDASGHRVRVITRAKSPRLFTENEVKMEHITVDLCISTTEGYVRPLCILPLKTLPPLELQVTGFFSISSQKNGFISMKSGMSRYKLYSFPMSTNFINNLATPTSQYFY